MPFAATWMDLEIFTLSEVSQTRRNIIWHPLYVESKKKWYKQIYLQNRKRLTDLENELMVARGRIVREFGMDMYTLLYLKWITNTKHMEFYSVLCGGLDGRGLWGRINTYLCIYVWQSHLLFTWNYHNIVNWLSVQFSSVAQSCLTLCDSMDCSMPGLPVQHQPLEFIQTHVHLVSDAIQPSHPLLSPSPPALSLSQHQGLFQWVSSSHRVAKVLEFQLQHQSFQWTPRTDLL